MGGFQVREIDFSLLEGSITVGSVRKSVDLWPCLTVEDGRVLEGCVNSSSCLGCKVVADARVVCQWSKP